MLDRSSNPEAPEPKPAPVPASESYGRIVARPTLVLLVLALLAAWQFRTRPAGPQPSAPPPASPTVAKVVEVEVPPPPVSKPVPRPKRTPKPAPPAPSLDLAAVARAEESLDQASRERARAEARLAEAEQALQAATVQAAKDMAENRALAGKVRDPSARIAAVAAKGGFLKGERDKLKNELAALERVPQPKSKALMAKSAVAKPTDGTEFHFEIRHNKVSFVDLDRLVEMVKTDARIRLRAGGQRGRLLAMVGPVGSFSLRYELGRMLPDGIADAVDSRETSYNLLGWEIVPDGNNRGDTYEATRSPASAYGRAVNRLTPGRDTITMWIYPDGFALYRKLRDDLHARGFLVAARPLPEGTAIRGSPVGSLSAGQ
jgi:hypothetical protein